MRLKGEQLQPLVPPRFWREQVPVHNKLLGKRMALMQILTSWRDVMTDAVRADGPDLSMRQWSILLTVYTTPGPHTVRGLARALNVPKPAISRALDALSILGFVRRVRDDSDKRIVLVQKTADGSIYLDQFARIVESRTESAQPLNAMYG